jgi:hypothetical protein
VRARAFAHARACACERERERKTFKRPNMKSNKVIVKYKQVTKKLTDNFMSKLSLLLQQQFVQQTAANINKLTKEA